MSLSIEKEFDRIFRGEQVISKEEQDLLRQSMLFMLDDRELGLAADVLMVWSCKITGVIEFMEDLGKINDSQEEDLMMILNAIEAGECTAA